MRALWLTVALLSIAVAANAEVRRYVLEPGEHQEVRFTSEAPLESFDGVTSEVKGWIEADLDAEASAVRWSIEVDLVSLDTGIGLRNRHLRENHLHVDRYPTAVFRGEVESSSAKSGPDGARVYTLTGEFDLHGITRERTLEIEVRRLADQALELRAEFEVRLDEHDIPRPKFLFMKLAQEQRVRVRLRAVVAGEESTP